MRRICFVTVLLGGEPWYLPNVKYCIPWFTQGWETLHLAPFHPFYSPLHSESLQDFFWPVLFLFSKNRTLYHHANNGWNNNKPPPLLNNNKGGSSFQVLGHKKLSGPLSGSGVDPSWHLSAGVCECQLSLTNQNPSATMRSLPKIRLLPWCRSFYEVTRFSFSSRHCRFIHKNGTLGYWLIPL